METVVILEQKIMDKKVRIFGDWENPLFAVQDIADMIGHTNSRRMVELAELDPEEVSQVTVRGVTNCYTLNVVTEDGFNEIMMHSNKPLAKEYKKEIKRILKSYRKHGIAASGSFIEQALADPEFAIKTLQALKEERALKEAAQKQVKEISNDYLQLGSAAADFNAKNLLHGRLKDRYSRICKQIEQYTAKNKLRNVYNELYRQFTDNLSYSDNFEFYAAKSKAEFIRETSARLDIWQAIVSNKFCSYENI